MSQRLIYGLKLCLLSVSLVLLPLQTSYANTAKPEGFDQLPFKIQSRWDGAVLDLDWEDLIPDGYRADAILDQYDPEKIAQLTDDDPLMLEIMAKLEKAYQTAPVVLTLNSQPVRLGGYVVPLEITPDGVTEFLLVPFFGACVHVPPPPSNQIIYVKTEIPLLEKQLEDAVWVSGRLSVTGENTALAQAGYTLYAEHIVPVE
ncbi:hypothetical protein SAMN02745127_02546 [Oceanospirillum multiglobuliferum]|uniref:DUF3299 domain-containing protein n=1 Tax=Oceanospirillum multiglobuliferum TaxID=64969 RepID=A0A1T4RS02_9GAMM|nr:DUF3299 domain-containing protein [Oceanospirillum multiglobuliferum]OPX54707.1 hypothetical protein BTE48_13080 [Oceanospirillum multiglobuliferum]SKA18712.1 hypothetical protein SAMN02745127_02546 [Oceanospirillum multiglobuliferum]